MLSAVTARLLLIRHGESTWNAEHRLQGQADPPLSPLGREQATALLPFLDDIPARRLSSDLTRAVQTAELLGLAGTPADPRWREIDIGDWAGFTLPELDPERVAAWQRGEHFPRETWAELQARVAAAVDELRGEDAIVVTHGGCIRAATAHLTGADARALAPPANASLTVIEHGDRVRLQAYGLRAPGPETPGLAGPALDGLEPRRADPGVLGLLGGRGRRRGVAQELLDRGDHRGRLLGEALEPCSSRRGRRFTTGCCRACASAPARAW